MSTRTIPVTVVLGWSASAKAEALRRIGGDPAEMAVVCSEPTEVPAGARTVEVAERVAEQSLGCPCCALRLDIRTAVFRLVARRRPPKHIIVVAGPEADPGPLLATLVCDLHMVRRTTLDAVVTVVDGRAAAVRLATEQPLAPGQSGEEHIAVADAVVVVGGNQLTDAARGDLARAVGHLNPFRPSWVTDDASWPGPAPGADGRVYALAGVAARLDGLDCSIVPTSRSVLFDIEGEAEPEALREWVQGVCGTQGERLLRLQAVCSLRSRTDRWACSAVRSFYATSWCAPGPGGSPRARVLAVGRDLDVDALAGPLRLALASA